MTATLINLQIGCNSMDSEGILKAFPKRKKIHANPSSKALAKIPKREEEGTGGEWTQSQNLHVLEPSDFLHCSQSDTRADSAHPALH